MNDIFEHLNLFFHLNLFCSSFLRLFAFLHLRILCRHVHLVYHASLLSLKSIFTLGVFLLCHNFSLCSKLEHCGSSIFDHRRYASLTSIFRVGFWQIDFRIVNKYRMRNENFSRQCIKSNHANKTNCTNAFEMVNIKERQLANVKEKGLCIYFFWVKRITVTVQWTLKVTHANKLQVLSRLSPLANVFSSFWVYFNFCLPAD